MNPKLFDDARLSLPVISTGFTQHHTVSNLRNFVVGESRITVGTVTAPDGSRALALVTWGLKAKSPFAYSPLAVYTFNPGESPRQWLERHIAICKDNLADATLPYLQYWYDSILVYQQVIRYGEQLGVL